MNEWADQDTVNHNHAGLRACISDNTSNPSLFKTCYFFFFK